MYFPIRTLYLTWKIEQRERRKFKHHCLEMDQMLVWIAFTEFAKSFNQSEQRYSFSANQVQNRNQSWLGFGFFLALSAGCIFSHALRWLQPGCMFFFALRWLQAGCIFSRAYRWLHVSPRFPPALCFPVLSTCCLLLSLVPFLPVLTSGCMFSIGIFIRFFFFHFFDVQKGFVGKKMIDVFFCPPDKMEAAAAVITSQRSSTGGNNTASSESQNATPAAVKTNTTGSETAQTSTAPSSTTSRTASSIQVSSSAHGMFFSAWYDDCVSFGVSCLTHRILQSLFLCTD